MPVGNASQRSSDRRRDPGPELERWAMPLGRWGSTRFYLSYAVFFSAAVVAAIVLALWVRPGNSDLPRAALIGVAFWIGGWLIQVITHLTVAAALGLRTRRLSIGLIGLEAAPRPWPAGKSLVVAIATIFSLLMLGILYRLIEGDFQMPTLSQPPDDIWRAPSLGLTATDSLWKSGAWLCWIQCLFQMYPLPRTMGRQSLAALTGICSGGIDLSIQSMILRRCLSAVALLTVFISVYLMAAEAETFMMRWPLLLMLGVLLWLSVHTSDVSAILAGFGASADESHEVLDDRQRQSAGPLASIGQAIQSRRNRKRVKQAMEKERSEAEDATQLDEILHRVHEAGIDSLSREERLILERVSRNLRDQRQTDAE